MSIKSSFHGRGVDIQLGSLFISVSWFWIVWLWGWHRDETLEVSVLDVGPIEIMWRIDK